MATNRNIGMSVGVALATAIFAFYQQRYAINYTFAESFVNSLRPVVYTGIGMVVLGIISSLVRENRVGQGVKSQS